MRGAQAQGLGDINMEILHELMGIIATDAPPAIERVSTPKAALRTESKTAG